MGKKHKSSQFPKSNSPGAKAPNPSSVVEEKRELVKPLESTVVSTQSQKVQPEQMSLNAYHHIQQYLDKHRKETKKLTKEDLNAVLRLSQHLRVFGLLSAVGYINQSNAQENNEVRKRTVPVWECLLGHLINKDNPPERQDLMAKIVEMAQKEPSRYMATWRRALLLAHHWNFWARAYQED
jgi:hypothetical protein